MPDQADTDKKQSGQTAEGAAPVRRKRRRWKRYALLGILLLLVGGEIGARVLADRSNRFNIFIGQFKEFDPYRRVRLRKNYDSGDIHINSKGILGPEFDARKKPGAFRIMVLGDSCSFIPAQRNYPRALEDILHDLNPGREIEVVNAACPGHDSGQARIWYEREIDGYDHDVLIIYLGWNDMGQYGPDGLAYKLDEAGYIKEPTFIQRAMLNCYLLRSLYVADAYINKWRGVSFEPLDQSEREKYDFYPEHFDKNMRTIINLAKSRGRQVYLLNFAGLVHESPSQSELDRMHFPRGMGKRLFKYVALVKAYDHVLSKLSAETDTPIIDIALAFENNPDMRRVFTDSMHFNVEGAEFIAKIVAEAIEPAVRDRTAGGDELNSLAN